MNSAAQTFNNVSRALYVFRKIKYYESDTLNVALTIGGSRESANFSKGSRPSAKTSLALCSIPPHFQIRMVPLRSVFRFRLVVAIISARLIRVFLEHLHEFLATFCPIPPLLLLTSANLKLGAS